MTEHDHLDLLRAHIERSVPQVRAFLEPGSRLLAICRRGVPGVHVRWSHGDGCYVWVSGPDDGGQVGTDAAQATAQIVRVLLR
jgi:hypothetical protein